MNIKKLKTKKVNIADISKEFLVELTNGMNKLQECINDLIDNKLDKSKLDEIVECEHNCDRIKENYIDLLFKDKRALPFLVEDRHKIILAMDSISDKTEGIARHVKVFPFEIFKEIKEELKNLMTYSKEVVDILINCIELMETNFSGAYKKTQEIEELKRKARHSKYDILEIIYKKKDEALRVMLTSNLTNRLFDLIAMAEEISDYLRGLIIKYPSK